LFEVVSTSTGVKFDVVSSACEYDFFEMTSAICLNGSKPGMLFVSADYSTTSVLCSSMTGVPIEEVTKEDCVDALCEFVNMTAGNAKLRLGNSEYLFTLTSPFVLEGKDMTIFTKKKVHVLSTVFASDDLTLKMKVVY